MTGLGTRQNAELGQTIDVLGQQVLEVLERVAPLHGRPVPGHRFAEDVDGLVDGAVADGVDAHGVTALGSGEDQLAHAIGRYRGATAVAVKACIRIRLGQPCGVLAAHAVEELLEARSAQQGELIARITVLQILEARPIVEQRGVHVHTQGEFAFARELLIHVVADEIAAGMRHEGHVADRGDALLGHTRHLGFVGGGDVFLSEPLEAARKELHRRGLADDARELTVLILVVTAALRRHGVARDAEGVKGARVHPERMTVARVHHAGTVRECLVERMLGGRHGRVPAVITPALSDHPGMLGKPLREFDRPLHKLGLALPHVHEQVG